MEVKMHLATVDGEKLIRALTEVQGGGKNKHARRWVWAFGFDLTILWGRTGRRLLAEVHELGPIVVVVHNDVMEDLIGSIDCNGPTEIHLADRKLVVGGRTIRGRFLAGRNALRPVSGSDTFTDRADFRPAGSGDESSKSSAAAELYEKRRIRYLNLVTEMVRGPDGLLDGRFVNTGRSVTRVRASYSIPILDLDELYPDKPGAPRPKWKYPSATEHVDHISVHEEGMLFTYDVKTLDDADLTALPVYQMILRALGELSNEAGELPDRAFTVFGGLFRPAGTKFAIGLNATSQHLTSFLGTSWKLESQAGPTAGEVGYLRPLFRYDHGHFIFYNEEGGHGNSALDDEGGFETGLPLLVRGYEKVETESCYGELTQS
jgi:hypothetical protein